VHTQAANQEATALERIWESHRESVRRLLIALGRDIDLADDLLQETYLRARAGISSYRGANPRAWLAAIAKNAFYSYARQRHVQCEVPLDDQPPMSADAGIDRVDLLAVRQAIADLSPPMRTALIMKHYCGFTYREIAGHMRCPVGTAKWRVAEALDALRAALRAERREAMAECRALDGISIVDYVYGVLPEGEAAKMEAHLAQCASCREQADGLRQVVSLLDALEGDYRQMHFVELDREGGATIYCASSQVNDKDLPLETTEFQCDNDAQAEVEHLYQDGDELEYTVAPHPEYGNLNYTITLRQAVPPGGCLSLLTSSSYPSTHRLGASRIGDERFRLSWKHGPSSNLEFAHVRAIRLPSAAHLLSADPEPDETRGDAMTTLIWRRVLPPGNFFEGTVEYRLEE
jgi:RNA polymerase sigma-70 factor (ECF subfamily)